MKNALFSFCLLCALSLQAQPLLVGHRGSGWGLENSEESFINGAKKGYHYLETDVKVTSDRQFVCCHNDDLKTWGGTLTIATNTLAALQAEQLSQTRNGVKYTGHLCSVAEYLDICNEYGAKPLIELKWATGINNNDCSNIPALVKLIEEKGFRSTCIILTSMRPCLEYIRKNYPDITLQYLVNSMTDSAYEFCKTHGIDVDCRNDGINLTSVRRWHAVGLKVNVWTANTNADYKVFGDMGCDFITTDRLDPADLPVLNVDDTPIPNEIDYPAHEVAVQGLYSPVLISQAALPEFLQTVTVRRTLLKDGKLYVLAWGADNTPILTVLNPETGKELRRMSLGNIVQSTHRLSDIAFTSDGYLLGCSEAVLGKETLHIYQWASDEAQPQSFLTLADPKLVGDWHQAIAGGQMTVSGRLSDCFLWLTAYDASLTVQDAAYHLLGIQTANGSIIHSAYAAAADYNATTWGVHPQIIPSPANRNHIIVDSPDMLPKEYVFNWETNDAMKEYAALSADVLPAEAIGVNCFRAGAKVYAALANNISQIAMFDITKGINRAKAVTQWMPEDKDYCSEAQFRSTHIALKDGLIYLYLFDDREGISVYFCPQIETVIPKADADFVLKKEWERSTVLGNAPEHIDGSNAQQGGAFNGYFYVNDCADRLVYVFDSTGCVGSLPGGAGWGTAIDDVGNIIVRNDKSTSASHSFLIYPSGTKVDNPITPLSLEVEVAAAGQTNFISASGDVLSGMGYIYMYPNGQKAVNILTLSKGKVIYSELCDGLDMTGSTAGYVIPIGNNSENWLYQVRSSGFTMYNGGNSTDFFKSRSSTTAPARNTTVGGDCFNLAGHQIFVHPSGKNYQGGFTVRNMTKDEVIASVDPIGTNGYGEGGNMSCSNWIFAEPLNQDSARIYLYCPSNGMAVYTLYDRNVPAPPVDGLTNVTESLLYCYPNPATRQVRLSLDKKPDRVELFTLTGLSYHPVIRYTTTELMIDIARLPAGQYILRVDGKLGKFIKE